MAGVYPLSRQQQYDPLTNKPLQGGRLFLYQAGTSTPLAGYKDFGLTTTHPSPIVLLADGRVPQIYLADGTYRHRLENQSGIVQFDDDSVPTTGQSSGGSGATVFDPNALFQVGDPIWLPVSASALRAGWVRMNARTIGNASSGANERANADTQALYLYLWNNYADALCPVTGGRGASAAADYAANRPIGLPDMRGLSPFGLDDMGNTAAGRLSSTVPFQYGSNTTPGAQGGEALHTLAIGEIPVFTPTATLTLPSATLTNPSATLTNPSASLTNGSIVNTNGPPVFSGNAVTPTWSATNSYTPGTISLNQANIINNAFGTNSGGTASPASAANASTVQPTVTLPSFTPTGACGSITPSGTCTLPAYVISGGSVSLSGGSVALSGGSVALSGGSVSVNPIGGGGNHNNMPPFRLGTWFIKL